MALGLTQGEMDGFSAEMLGLLPAESVTFAKVGETSCTVTAHTGEFTKHERAVNPALVNMRKMRIAVGALVPTRQHVITRSDNTRWDVDMVTGGSGRPWWILTIRQVI